MEIGPLLFRLRGYTPYPIVLLFLFFASPTALSFLYGGLLMAAGEALRIWSVAYAGRETRTLYINAGSLVTCGPYAYVRNPLYIGNMLIYTGATLIANFWLPYLLFAVWLYFGFQYYTIIRAEERALSAHFGDVYRDYRRRVPAYLPRLSASPGETFRPDYRLALASERSTFLSLAAVMAILVFRAFVGAGHTG